MAILSLIGSKILLALCNFLLMILGFTLVVFGTLLLFDSDRLLLSMLVNVGEPFFDLSHPLLYYLALGVAMLGLCLSVTGIIGCWASCLHSYCMVSTYFVIIMLLLIGECAIYTAGWSWPQCIGLITDPKALTKSLQKNYGIDNKEQFTAAIDLAQSTFNCCGIESANEYDTSLWRLQALGPSLAVPLTCCKLINEQREKAYLNPQPKNTTLCQALEKSRHEGYRHTEGCKHHMEQWYRYHYIIFLGFGLLVVIIEFLVLLSTILTCNRIYHFNEDARENNERNLRQEAQINERSYHKSLSSTQLAMSSRNNYNLNDSFDKSYKETD